MSQLILRDKDGHELERREMHPSERYQIYEDCRNHELLTVQNRRFSIHTVAWLVPEENCVVKVTFHSYEACDRD